ncbi:DHH family phosphoesterase [Halobaculum gomorrense]|uniref:RecJ-like exonuclease, contains DnaJ-type Zn finger domain n=1 Tax=Halobaculum gomorrense TaxID=43928 RepID=A0A1M5SK13_9EURY|nr:OB-fold nucleic acid binding domain-containing protein [Halobaculum gomorrense]SHH38805.1 RecJ-like exonuclease, contains DnaJ-type Zn finger domain [Halobaculum gomorrense]
MGKCIICGASVDGRICSSHEEDVVFEFRGNDPNQLRSNRFYTGIVDGYADFGVFIDLSPNVTGLLHRSELDRRLESLDWEPGDEVFVQVKNVRENGDVDLAWSIRQAEREFRGVLIQEGTTEVEPDEDDDEGNSDGGSGGSDTGGTGDTGTVTHKPSPDRPDNAEAAEPDAGNDAEAAESDTGDDVERTDRDDENERGPAHAEATSQEGSTGQEGSTDDIDAVRERKQATPEGAGERVDIGTLSDRVGESIRIEGEVVSARQTGGPTVFELRDETGVVDCAAFVQAGVRAYPEIDVGDIVRLEGDVEVRRNEVQVETEALAALAGDEAAAVERRLADALTDEARPDGVSVLGDHPAIDTVGDELLDAAESVRRAVIESRPIVVRHAATADGYVAGAAVERAVLPLIREEHAKSDAEYHYFTRRPLDEPVYDMDAATKDATRMLQDRDRHGEQLPLVLLLGTGSTVESQDGLDLLGVYGAERVVVDAATADPEIADTVATLVNPGLAGAETGDLTTGALGSVLAATVNGDVTDDVAHLPAVSYWEGTPETYADLAADAGVDAERVSELREAVALEAYYQSYQDKRELIADILFDSEGGDLAGHIAGQFREKLETEVDTAEANIEEREVDGRTFATLDADAYSHRFDFPSTTLLADELQRRGDRDATVVYGTDELYVRADGDVDVREAAGDAAMAVPDASVTAVGVRQGRIEYLAGRRDEVTDAVVDAVAGQLQ